MVSQGCVVGRTVIVERGQASPSEVPSRAVRDGGQIGARPSMSTDQRVGRGTIGTEEAWVVGCESR
jgi:hypothetical protein